MREKCPSIAKQMLWHFLWYLLVKKFDYDDDEIYISVKYLINSKKIKLMIYLLGIKFYFAVFK